MPPKRHSKTEHHSEEAPLEVQGALAQYVDWIFPLEPTSLALVRLAESKVFELLVTAVIIVNAVSIGVQSQVNIGHALSPSGAGPSTNLFSTAGGVFTAFYSFEILVKAGGFRRNFVMGADWRWNLFDAFLVVTALYETIADLARDSGSNAGSVFMVLRLLRLLKLLRLVRLMRAFAELRVMLLCIVGSARTLFWTVLMLGLIMYLFGLCFIEALSSALATGNVSEETRNDIAEHWGSVTLAMVTLFEAISGGNDWANLAKPLKSAGTHYYLLFIFYIAFLTISVLNVLTGIFVDAAMAVMTIGDDELCKDDEHGNSSANLNAALMLSGEDGRGEDGFETVPPEEACITWEAFAKHADDPLVFEFLDDHDLRISDAHVVFSRLARLSKTGDVLVGDFVSGCINLRGLAKSFDLSCMSFQMKTLTAQVDELAKMVSKMHPSDVALPHVLHKRSQEPSQEPFDNSDLAKLGAALRRCSNVSVLKAAAAELADRIRNLEGPNASIDAPDNSTSTIIPDVFDAKVGSVELAGGREDTKDSASKWAQAVAAAMVLPLVSELAPRLSHELKRSSMDEEGVAADVNGTRSHRGDSKTRSSPTVFHGLAGMYMSEFVSRHEQRPRKGPRRKAAATTTGPETLPSSSGSVQRRS